MTLFLIHCPLTFVDEFVVLALFPALVLTHKTAEIQQGSIRIESLTIRSYLTCTHAIRHTIPTQTYSTQKKKKKKKDSLL